ncbi:MAG: SOS response-associated peptidase [Rhodospirillaceae bacterium]|nr:SOS response-associated peptidase [Rhodospirillaceae bacterium]
MCGRYKLTTPTGVIVEDFGIRSGRLNLAPRFNIAPTQSAPVVRHMAGTRTMAMLRWGLIPSWAKDTKIAFSTTNARAETVADKPAFRDAFKARRALVVADGFYEWKSEAGGKQPYLIARKDERPMAFAGLWERWQPQDGTEAVESFTIIVTAANALISDLHDRMPVILDPAQFDMWLDADHHPPSDVLKPYDPARMYLRPVSRALNSVQNEGPELLDAPRQQAFLL